jgi:hypothetical protein
VVRGPFLECLWGAEGAVRGFWPFGVCLITITITITSTSTIWITITGRENRKGQPFEGAIDVAIGKLLLCRQRVVRNPGEILAENLQKGGKIA